MFFNISINITVIVNIINFLKSVSVKINYFNYYYYYYHYCYSLSFTEH